MIRQVRVDSERSRGRAEVLFHTSGLCFAIASLFLKGCGKPPGEQPVPTASPEAIRIQLPEIPKDHTVFGEVLVFAGAPRPLPEEIIEVLLPDDARLRRERDDFMEVVRVARREIAAVERERQAHTESLQKALTQIDALRRDRAAEVNLLWSRAVAPLDARFAERARRFQVMLATRIRDRGGDWPADTPLMEPAAARELFERQSRAMNTWSEDETWLEGQWRGWRIYEQAWREARARIRSQSELLRSETFDRLTNAEATIAQNEERIAQLDAREQELRRPLAQALTAALELQTLRLREAERCTSELLAALAHHALARLSVEVQEHQIATAEREVFFVLPLINQIGEVVILISAPYTQESQPQQPVRLTRITEFLPR